VRGRGTRPGQPYGGLWQITVGVLREPGDVSNAVFLGADGQRGAVCQCAGFVQEVCKFLFRVPLQVQRAERNQRLFLRR
jgi:hypothetical protein